MNRQLLKGGLFVFLGASSFGILSTVIKTAYSKGYTVGEITGVQTFYGFIFLWASFSLQKLFTKKSQKEKICSQPLSLLTTLKIILSGSFTGLVGIFYYLTINYLPASVAIILLMQYLWITLTIEVIFFKKKPNTAQLVATVFAILGAVLAGGAVGSSVELNVKGVVFGMLAALSYSIFLLTSGRVGNNLPVLKKRALIITGSWLISWLIFPPVFFFNGAFTSGLYQWGILIALMGTVIPPLFFAIGIPKTGVSLAAIISAIELPAAVLMAYIVLKEPVDTMRWVGVVMILVAIILPNLKTRLSK